MKATHDGLKSDDGLGVEGGLKANDDLKANAHGLGDQYMIAISKALRELEGFKKLKRLDIMSLPPLGPEGMRLLVKSIASPACAIHDLGINLSSSRHLNDAQHKARFSVLAQAFQSGSSLSKLKALRFRSINTSEAANCVVEILGCPQSNCKVRLLQLVEYADDEPFFKKLQQGITPRIDCLAIDFIFGPKDSQRASLELSSLSDFLGWGHCSLLWLQCSMSNYGDFSNIDESLQTKIANSLEANHLLTYLQIDALKSPAARSRAAAFLARNRLYKSMALSKDDCMKPQVGRLFLCGDGEVGKTTLSKSLLKLHSHDASCSFNKLISPNCMSTYQGVEPRTRGLEIHQLCFQSDQKLAIFDLAGQQDYHVFHHYFMTNTSHDLFIIVGKYSSATKSSELDVELEYWLRFIVSHRNSVHGPNPRILLVLNFFHAKVADMQGMAEYLTQDLRHKYAQHLDFAGVFGIIALNKREAKPILDTLERLLQDSLDGRPMIPRVCHDLLTSTLPQFASHKKQLACGIHLSQKSPEGKLFVEYLQVKERYIQQQEQQRDDRQQQTQGQAFNILEKRIRAALVELHNTGEVIFFPPIVMSKSKTSFKGAIGDVVAEEHALVAVGSPSSSQSTKDFSPIITDPNWFCNKVIGDLLAPTELLSGKSEWKLKDIKQVLINSGCPKPYVSQVLRYLQSLELCYPFHDNTKYFFPAVANDGMLQWPAMFSSQIATMHFYGRRIRCKETERHLIPSGVFSRLQVRLNEFCGVGNDRSFKLGYHWASFVTQNIGVMVRFGRVSTRSNVQDANQASTSTKQIPLSICMMEDDHPEWIDILLCCPSLQNAQQQATSAEYFIMNGIRRLIYEICQATSRGIPTVTLEECVLSYEAQKHVMPLEEVKSSITEKGLRSHVAWEDQESIVAVDLLLPEELHDHVLRHVQAVQKIGEEFAVTLEGEGEGKGREKKEEEGHGDQLLYQQLPEELKVLYHLLSSKLNKGFERLGAKMENIMVLVREIKQDVGKIMDGLQRIEMKILADFSTRLLTQVLLQGVLPAYPYLTNSEGKMEKLKRILVRETATIHFLCESGPHEVKGQIGKKVVVKKGVLMKMAPFLVPTLMVLCCAARFAANVYLPGIAPIVFSPLLERLKSIGITQQELQSNVISPALKALFDELDIKIQQLYDPKSAILNVDEHQRKEGVEALQEFLGSIEDIEMGRDFGLSLVQVGHETDQLVQAQWLCKDHANEHKRLRHSQNPFSHIAK